VGDVEARHVDGVASWCVEVAIWRFIEQVPVEKERSIFGLFPY
jgi:hypothetical protein